MGAGPATEAVEQLIAEGDSMGGTMEYFDIAPDMYKELEAELFPLAPAAYFGVPFRVRTVH